MAKCKIAITKDTVVAALMGAVVGVVIGAVGMFALGSYNPSDEDPADTITTVFGRIVEQNELVSVSQDYVIVEKATDTNKLFGMIDIPFTDNSFWYQYVGTIKAGVSLEDAEYDVHGKTIRVKLTNPYIISNTPDMDQTGVLEERNSILNPIHVEDVDALQKTCVERSQAKAEASGLLNEAKTNAENNIRNMFIAALGDEYTVEFEWAE